MKVDILGTKYKIITRKISEDEYMSKNSMSGYCDEYGKYIVIADVSEDKYFPTMDSIERDRYRKEILRHEIIHAFLNESGLSDNASTPASAWAKHEEMVDWMAIQFPKIIKAFKKVGAI